MRDLSPVVSNYRASGTLGALMADNGVAGLSGVDTRALTRRIRTQGSLRAVLTPDVENGAAAVSRAKGHPSLEGRDLVKEVTTEKPYDWDEGLWQPFGTEAVLPPATKKVVAYDFGVKRGILRHLRQAGCAVHVVPASTPAADVLAMKPDGIFLSNGPGDPAAVTYAVDNVRAILAADIPVFGICLGFQIMGLALGGPATS